MISEYIEAFTIIAKYDPEGHLEPAHDEFWVGYEATPDKMTSGEIARLEELGFTWDDDIEGWHTFT